MVNQYLQWHIAEVTLSDNPSAQVQTILYKYNAKDKKWHKPQKIEKLIYINHLDNENECTKKYILEMHKLRYYQQKERIMVNIT